MAGCKETGVLQTLPGPLNSSGTRMVDAGAVFKVILGEPGIPGDTVHPSLWLLRSCVCWT